MRMEVPDRGVPSLFIIPPIQFLVGILLFIALLYGQRDLIVLTLLVLGVMGGARLWARMSLSGVQYRLRVDKQKVFPGEPLTLRITAENAKLLPIWLEMKIPIGSLLQHSSGEKVLTKESSLLWYQKTDFQWELTAGRRGVYEIGPLHILAGDLFSFFSRRKRAEEFHSIIVYPRLVSLKSISLPRLDFFGVPRAKSPVQDPIYILGTRDYQYGQPSKYIHWKASARHNRLQEKVFESTQQEKVLLVVDVNPFARLKAEEDFERTLEIVASLAVRLDQQGHSIGLVTNGVVKGGGSAIVPVARNNQQLPAILELLARLQMKPERDLKDLLPRSLALAWGISCVYFSHQEDDTISVKEYFRQRKTPVVFFVRRPHFPAGEDRPEIRPMIHRMDDLCTKEVERK
jgi:uncharacterized protein (DUF58 family)